MVEFSDQLRWTFVMGGIARSFAPEGSRSGTLEPQVVARQMREWLEVSDATQAPVDPLVWVENPIRSTYPACMAAKAAAEQAADGGYRYLRLLREGVMCNRRRLDHAEPLVEEARAAGLDVERFRLALGSHAITEAFAKDLEETEAFAQAVTEQPVSSSRGAGGAPLPSLVFAGDREQRFVAGFQSYEAYRDGALAAGAQGSAWTPLSIQDAVARFHRLTTKEVEVLCDLPGPRAGAELFRLAEQWKLRPLRSLTGYLWEAGQG
jgi:predicted DsbA family dithiol-disulfide isomerase